MGSGMGAVAAGAAWPPIQPRPPKRSTRMRRRRWRKPTGPGPPQRRGVQGGGGLGGSRGGRGAGEGRGRLGLCSRTSDAGCGPFLPEVRVRQKVEPCDLPSRENGPALPPNTQDFSRPRRSGDCLIYVEGEILVWDKSLGVTGGDGTSQGRHKDAPSRGVNNCDKTWGHRCGPRGPAPGGK